MKPFSTLLVSSSLLGAALGSCANGCSGHGKCGAMDLCECHQNWQGADCSLRTCPFELAWVDTALRADDAHYYAECANKGLCDRKTGVCKCFDGYDGKGCQRSVCPDGCSGHGTCEFINELANDSEDRRVKGVDGLLYSETQWDWQKIQGCKCDLGWEGASCAARICPAGDDPLTSISKFVHEKQRISIGVPSKIKSDAAFTTSEAASTTTGAAQTTAAVTFNAAADLSAGAYRFKANDMIHIVSNAADNTSTKWLKVTADDTAAAITTDQLIIHGAAAVVYRTHSTALATAAAVTANTQTAASTFTKTLTLSADALLLAGHVIVVDGSSYVVQAFATPTATLDKFVKTTTSAGSASEAVQTRVFAAPAAGDQWFATYYDPYGGQWNTTAQTVTASVTADATTFQTALRTLPNHVLDDVTVFGYQTGTATISGFHEDGTASKAHIKNAYEFIVTFQGTTGTSGYQNMFEVEGRATAAGSFPVSAGLFKDFATNKYGTSLATVSKDGASGKTTLDRSELSPCSNRGLCDASSGQCKCFVGFRGLACEFQEALV